MLGGMDERLTPAPVVAAFGAAVRPVAGVLAFYAGGSLATGDFRPGISDLDLVAIVARPLSPAARGDLLALHESFAAEHDDAAKLHCAYVPEQHATDVGRKHLWWAHGRLLRRPFSGIGRGELQQGGIVVHGAPPAAYLPPLSRAELAEAARVELRGYWTGAVRRTAVWHTDLHVDLGLTTVSRADATIGDGGLITKREAIARLPRLGVPDHLAAEIAERRAGRTVTHTDESRQARAVLARGLMRENLVRLLR
jgi:hypothetical protein